MTSATEIFRCGLAAPFPANQVRWRVVSKSPSKDQGRVRPFLAEIAIQDRFDEVCGQGAWQVEYRVVEVEGGEGRKPSAVFCAVSLLLGDHWVTKEDVAHISVQKDSEASAAAQDPIKAAVSDAFRRSAALWGVGRYLAGAEAPWVPLDANGRIASVPVLPDHLLPEAERGQIREQAAAPTTAVAPGKPVAPTAEPEAPSPAAEKQETSAPAPMAAARAARNAAASKATPAATPAAAADAPPTAAAAPESQSEASVEGADAALDAAIAKLEGKALEVARNVIDRVRKNAAPIPMLRNYLNGEAAQKLLNAEVLKLLHEKLDRATAALQAAA